MLEQLRKWRRTVKRDTLVLYVAARDPRVPWYVKALSAAVAAYVLSPVDLIPDFIPVLGQLDDVILVPIAITLIARLIPRPIMAELQQEAEARIAAKPPRSRTGTIVVTVFVVALVVVVVWLVWLTWFR